MTTVEKIAKLLAKAESLKQIGNLEEAQTFAAHASRLMLTNQITLSDIENVENNHQITNHNELIEQTGYIFKMYQNKAEGTWESGLLNAIAFHNFCCALFKGNDKATLIGTASNIEVVKFIFEVLKEKFRKAANDTYNIAVISIREKYSVLASTQKDAFFDFITSFPEFEYEVKETDFMPKSYAGDAGYQPYYLKSLKVVGLPDRGVYTRSFLLGANNGLWDRFASDKKKFMEDLQDDTQEIRDKLLEEGEFGLVKSSKSLIKVIKEIELKNKEKIKEFVSKNIGKVGNMAGERAGDYGAAAAGAKFAQNVSINKGVGYTGNSTKALNG